MGESNWRDTLARCPFYEQSSIATRAGRISKITCDWIPEGTKAQLQFPDTVDMVIHWQTFCCGDYEKCELFNAIREAKEDE